MILPFFVFGMEKLEDNRFLGLKEITVQEKSRIMQNRQIEKSGRFGGLYFNQEEIIKDKENIYYLPLSEKGEWEKGKITGETEEINICIVIERKKKEKTGIPVRGRSFEASYI